MKYTNLLLVLSSAILSLSTLGFEPWSGEKLFINKELTKTNVIKIELKAFGEATVVNRDGKTEAKYKFQNNNEELVLDMSKNTNSSTGFPVVNSLDQGTLQVEMTSTILEMTLSGTKYNVVYKTMTKNCYKGYDPVSQMAGKDGCEIKESEFGDDPIIDAETMTQPLYLEFNVQAGDIYSLPTDDFSQDFYVSLNSDGTVKKLDNNNSINVTNWKSVSGKLVLTTDTGVTYEYQKLRDVHGLTQVLMTVNMNDFVGNQKLDVALVAKDDNLNLTNLKMEHVAGHYLSATHNHGEALIYEFNNDGIGGFDNPNRSYSKWSWKVENGLMVADRYIMLDDNDNYVGYAESDEDFRMCTMIEVKCHKYQSRSYKILSKDGNRFVLRRKLGISVNYASEGNASYENGRTSLWVFYKK